MAQRTHRRLRGLVRRRRDSLVPPRSLHADGAVEFMAVGEALLEQCVTLGGLLPDDRVLDIGSGLGRAARPIARFLSASGSYAGFDIDADDVAWCTERYAAFPNVQFEHGGEPASEYRFPYEDAGFDFVLSGSVFTHLVTAEAERYLRETARVLAPGGRALLAFFLLDLGSRAALTQGRATMPFDLDAVAGPMVVVDAEQPEEAVAFEHLWLEDLLADCGLRLVNAVPGAWRGVDGPNYQDLVVLERLQ